MEVYFFFAFVGTLLLLFCPLLPSTVHRGDDVKPATGREPRCLAAHACASLQHNRDPHIKVLHSLSCSVGLLDSIMRAHSTCSPLNELSECVKLNIPSMLSVTESIVVCYKPKSWLKHVLSANTHCS